MVPSHFVLLESLPFTSSGKLDRQGLPALESATEPHPKAFVEPRNALERVLTRMYCEVLDRRRVSVVDHFFAELSGHSLLATQLVSRIRDAFQIDLPLRAVFDHPTVRMLATHLAGHDAQGDKMCRIAELLLDVGECSEEQVETRLARYE